MTTFRTLAGRTMPMLLVLALLSGGLAGCFEGEQEGETGGGGQAPPLLPAGVRMAGSETIFSNETSIAFLWQGEAPTVVLGAQPGHTETTLEVPAGAVLTVAMTLTWEEPAADLDVSILGPSGDLLCVTVSGGALVGNLMKERCAAGTNPPRETPETWTIQVSAFHNPGPPLPFQVHGHVSVPSRSAVDPTMADRFAEPVLVGTGGDVEASLFIHDDGTMLACSHGGFRKSSPLWASEDGGLNWRAIDVVPNAGPSGDCDVAITDDGAWYIAYHMIDATGPSPAYGLLSVMLASSTDEGDTWELHPMQGQLVTRLDRPWIVPDGDDLVMTYMALKIDPAVHGFTRTSDRGATWTPHRPMGVSEPPERPHKTGVQPISWNGGATFLVPVIAGDFSASPTESWLQYHRSDDGGLTWRTATALGPFQAPSSFVGGARASEGTLFLGYHEGPHHNGTLHVVWSLDDGASWSEPVTVATGLRNWHHLTHWMDARADGTVTVAWMDRVDDGVRLPGWQVVAARVDPDADDPVVFKGGITETVDFNQPFEFNMVRHDAEGRAHIVYVMEEEGCADDPGLTRSTQCVYLVSERDSTRG